jgi:hypothetical protein
MNVTSKYGIHMDSVDIEGLICLSKKDIKLDQCLLIVFWTKASNEWSHYNRSSTEQFALFNAELQTPSITVQNLIAIVKKDFIVSSPFDEYVLTYNPQTLEEKACNVCKRYFRKNELTNIIPSSIVNKIYH